MCMDDIRIGRQLNTNIKAVSVPATTLTRLASADPKRVSISFGAADTMIYYQPGPISQAAPIGYGSLNQDAPMTLDIQLYGQAIIQEWFAWSPVAANVVMVIENSLEKQ